ncbi:formylglycine-generating enzyme family protein [Methylovulum psychrotolerans]|uniref:Sulfatase-modifying factor enzyme-like domain-containing protein n=1 Tax=Methylovulum psychrotolerans TaxID=1704499 RepID=A0A1Z4BWW5_9GAMM|nr:SUMF1/EgtB/PvdO family nonheme iron enzyme [Methylovulum psychrotolerans]ASF45761.1 hypothetical protein CEK71_06565 [Methylovulum psychrotolerans]
MSYFYMYVGCTRPWGKEYLTGFANIDEIMGDVGPHYLQRTSAVGIYPQGNSRQGISDLSGNVWEWCLNSYQDPGNTALSGTFSRVLRGGSWYRFQGHARASYRLSRGPGLRYGPVGFRVCCASPI